MHFPGKEDGKGGRVAGKRADPELLRESYELFVVPALRECITVTAKFSSARRRSPSAFCFTAGRHTDGLEPVVSANPRVLCENFCGITRQVIKVPVSFFFLPSSFFLFFQSCAFFRRFEHVVCNPIRITNPLSLVISLRIYGI